MALNPEPRVLDDAGLTIKPLRLTTLLRQMIAAVNGLVGLPAGGTTGQVLSKTSNADYDATWAAAAAATVGPTFKAYRGSTAFAMTSGAFARVALNTKAFDTAAAFDATTNFRFVAPVAGYYQVNGTILFQAVGSSMNQAQVAIYKNGVAVTSGGLHPGAGGLNIRCVAADVIFLAVGDYLELFGYVDFSTGTTANAASSTGSETFLSGCWLRA